MDFGLAFKGAAFSFSFEFVMHICANVAWKAEDWQRLSASLLQLFANATVVSVPGIPRETWHDLLGIFQIVMPKIAIDSRMSDAQNGAVL